MNEFQEFTKPIMCSYKLVTVQFDVWALATRVESFVHKVSLTLILNIMVSDQITATGYVLIFE